MKVAAILPVPGAPLADAAAVLERAWGSLEHGRALARAGVDVQFFLAGPRRETVDAGDGVIAELFALRGRTFVTLVRAALATNPDLVHLFHLREPSALVTAAWLGDKVVAEYNGGTPPSRDWVRRAMRAASHRLHALVFTAQEIAAPFYETRTLSARPALWELPEISSRLVDVVDRDAAKKRVGACGEPMVLIVGRQAEPKDPACALAAFRILAQTETDAHLWWATWGVESQAIRAAVEHDPHVHVLNVTDPRKMADLYAAADVMLHASRREICGAAFIEALQQGCPVAATNIPAFRRNTVEGAVTLAPVGEARELARGALKLLAKDRARTIARQHYETSLSFDAIAARRLRYYPA